MPVEVTMEGTRLEVGDSAAALMKTHERLIQLADTALRSVSAAGAYPSAVAVLAAHGTISAQALHLLCVIGRANQGRPIARTILETMINAFYIARDPGLRATRFWEFRPIPLAKAAEARHRVFGIAEGLDVIRSHAAEARAKLAPLKHWAG